MLTFRCESHESPPQNSSCRKRPQRRKRQARNLTLSFNYFVIAAFADTHLSRSDAREIRNSRALASQAFRQRAKPSSRFASCFSGYANEWRASSRKELRTLSQLPPAQLHRLHRKFGRRRPGWHRWKSQGSGPSETMPRQLSACPPDNQTNSYRPRQRQV